MAILSLQPGHSADIIGAYGISPQARQAPVLVAFGEFASVRASEQFVMVIERRG